MSLINQALRKAQQDRSPKRMADPSEPNIPGGHYAAPSSGMQLGLIIAGIAVFALLIGLVVGLSVIIFQKQAPISDQAIATSDSAPREAVSKPETVITPSAPKEIVPAPAPEASVLDQLRIAREEAEAEAAKEAAAKAEAERIAKLAPNEQIIDWLSRSKVTGVRLSTSGNSKAIINDEAYSVGEYVHYSMGLKLIVIQESRLLFEDANGKRYMKRL